MKKLILLGLGLFLFAASSRAQSVDVSGGFDRSIRLWDLVSGGESKRLAGHDDYVRSLALSGNGRYLLSGGDDRLVKLWDTATGAELKTLKGHDLIVTSLAFSPDATLLAVGSGNASVVIWEVQTGKLSRVLR